MIYLMSLFAAVALLVIQDVLFVSAQMERGKELDNRLEPNVPLPQASRRRLRKFIRISEAPPPSAKHAFGTQLQLVCEAMGSPAPSIQWLKNGDNLLEFEEETNEIFSAHPSSIALLVSTLTLIAPSSNIEDVYTCVATNGLSTVSASSTVYSEQGVDSDSILGLTKLLTAPRKPVITNHYKDLLQDMGTRVILPCLVDSHPKSQLLWQDNNDVPVNFSGNPRMRVLPSGSLVINDIRWTDMGAYTCSVKNVYGKDSVSTFLYPVKA